MNNSYLTEMDMYCIARLLQSSFMAPEPETINTHRSLYGCMYCKYAYECRSSGFTKFNFQKVFEKLEKLTGVTINTVKPNFECLGKVFLPASYYLEHPEEIYQLEQVHSSDVVKKIKASLDKIIARSKNEFDQQQDN